jgi:HEAT repeat protein
MATVFIALSWLVESYWLCKSESSDKETILICCERLKAVGTTRALPALSAIYVKHNQLGDDCGDQAIAAGEAICRRQQLNALGELHLMLTSENDRIRSFAVVMLRELGAAGIPELRKALKDSAETVCVPAMFALGCLGHQARDAVDELVDLLTSALSLNLR